MNIIIINIFSKLSDQALFETVNFNCVFFSNLVVNHVNSNLDYKGSVGKFINYLIGVLSDKARNL